MSSTRKSRAEAGANEPLGNAVARLRDGLIEMLCRKHRLSIDVAEDAANEAAVHVLAEHDMATIAMEAVGKKQTFDERLFGMLTGHAKKYVGREQRKLGKNISENTPIGAGDDGDLKLGGLFTPVANTAQHIEQFAECKMFFRKHGRGFTPAEIDMLFGIGENVSILDTAKELGLTPEDVVKLRQGISLRARANVSDAK